MKDNICIGCGRVLETSPALSRYNHGDICSDCGRSEAFYGDFIGRYAPVILESQRDSVWPYDILCLNNITA